jgi:hypothetical protein
LSFLTVSTPYLTLYPLLNLNLSNTVSSSSKLSILFEGVRHFAQDIRCRARHFEMSSTEIRSSRSRTMIDGSYIDHGDEDIPKDKIASCVLIRRIGSNTQAGRTLTGLSHCTITFSLRAASLHKVVPRIPNAFLALCASLWLIKHLPCQFFPSYTSRLTSRRFSYLSPRHYLPRCFHERGFQCASNKWVLEVDRNHNALLKSIVLSGVADS